MSAQSAPKAPNLANLLLIREMGAERPGLCVRGMEQGSLNRQLESWREGDFLHHCSAEYASFQPAPRSTIALCYNCDGSLLASTHGDHTVKITSCHSGTLSRVLTGHRRTPWVVRFHPRNATLLASGSLDHEVRLWDATTGQCLAKHMFGKPIASLAFHVSAPILAIACGHKLYMWEYTVPGSPPVIVLRTRRSMRAVHFHPFGLPVVLTAEVQDPSPTSHLPENLTEDKAFVARNWGLVSRLRGAAARHVSGDSAGDAAPPQTSVQSTSAVHDAAYASHPLPTSMVPIGREVPFPALVPAPPTAPGSPAAAGDGFAAQLAAAYNASVWNIISEEQPPRVRLRMWRFDSSKPGVELDERCGLRLEVLDAVLCSEMGVHFSPCGKFLAATMACRGPFPEPAAVAVGRASGVEEMDWSPPIDGGAGLQGIQDHEREPSPPPHRPPPAPTLAPRHTAPQRVVFEVRVMSMDGSSLGEVVRARRVRAAHCLTSVQFSPTGDHILLAYGKKHSSLLRSLVMDGGTLMPMHTILEVVALKDMGLVRVLPSVEDEINAACFHPFPGGGLAYGTKEGRLRVVSSNRVHDEEPGIDEGIGEELRDLPEMVLLEQGWMLLQQQWERDSEVRDRLRREQRVAATREERAVAAAAAGALGMAPTQQTH